MTIEIDEALKRYLEAAVMYRVEYIIDKLRDIQKNIRSRQNWSLEEIDQEINRLEDFKRLIDKHSQ